MFRKRDLLQDHLRERFHVTLCSGGTPFSGILMSQSDLNFEFADVIVLNQKAEGRIFVDRINIDYMQRVTDAAG
jgi:hypothetical protein